MKNAERPLDALIGACLAGEEAARFSLYERFYAYTLTVSLHYCKDRREAEEVVQDTFVKVFRALPAFDRRQAFRPWLRTIIVRTAINHFRRLSQPNTVLGMDSLREHPFVENQALQHLQQEDLYRLLQMLPPAYRLVFNLHVLEGYTHPEIAELLGISIGTSKSNLAKARRKLERMGTSFLLSIKNSSIRP